MTAREPEQLCRYVFKVGNFDPDAFPYERSAEVAAIYLRNGGHALTGPVTFENAVFIDGSFKPSTQGMTLVSFVAPCARDHRLPTLHESDDEDVEW